MRVSRKKVSKGLPNNGVLLGFKNRDYLAKRVTQFSKESIVDMVINSTPGFVPLVSG